MVNARLTRALDSKDFAIGVLSTTAAILFVGLLIINTRPDPVLASGMTATAGDYVLTVGSDASADQELLYVIDAPTERLIVYRFNSARQRIEIVQGLDLAELRSEQAAPTTQQRGRGPGYRRP